MSSSNSNAASSIAAGAALGTAAGYALALWLLPYGGVSGVLAELTDKERLADAFISFKERIAKLTTPSTKEGEEAEGGDASASTTATPEAHPLSDPKMVLIARADLKMGKGKIGAQCGHAVSFEKFFLFHFSGFFFLSRGRRNDQKLTLSLSRFLSLPSLKLLGGGPLQEAPQGPRRPPPCLGARRSRQSLPPRRQRNSAAGDCRGGEEVGPSLARRRRCREDAGRCGFEDGAGGAGGGGGGGQADGEAEALVKIFSIFSFRFLGGEGGVFTWKKKNFFPSLFFYPICFCFRIPPLLAVLIEILQ